MHLASDYLSTMPEWVAHIEIVFDIRDIQLYTKNIKKIFFYVVVVI